MQTVLSVLLMAAASIEFISAFFGPDHDLPFVVMAKARRGDPIVRPLHPIPGFAIVDR
jgi:hypothetical protein